MNSDLLTGPSLAEIAERSDALADRLSALLNLVPGWTRNETATVEAAKAMLRWSRRLGWTITIAEEGKP